MQYFQHFQSEEFFPNCSSDEIAFCIGSNLFDNLLVLVMVLDVLRDLVQFPIYITSSYRDTSHNKRVGGSPTSQHLNASAIDFTCPSLDFESFQLLVQHHLNENMGAVKDFVGQVIIYHKRKFIHFGLRTQSHKQLTFLHYEQRDN